MGFFRGSFLFTFSVLLLASFVVLGLSLTLSTSLKYENVKKSASPLVSQLFDENTGMLQELTLGEANLDQVATEAERVMKQYCLDHSEYIFTFEIYTITVPCSTVSEGKEAILNASINSIIEQTYYRDYDCGFWKCFLNEQVPLFLISEDAMQYWKQKFYLALLTSAVLLLITFLLVENKLNWPILAGGILIVSAIPLLKIQDLIASFIPGGLGILSIFLGIFFSKAHMVFWIFFIIGLVLIGLGLGLKFSNLEFVNKMADKAEKKKSEKNTKAQKKVSKRK